MVRENKIKCFYQYKYWFFRSFNSLELNITERIHGAILSCYSLIKSWEVHWLYFLFKNISSITESYFSHKTEQISQLLHKKSLFSFVPGKSLMWVQLPLKPKEIEISLSLPKTKISNFDLAALSQSSWEKSNYRFVLKYLLLLNCTKPDVYMHFLFDMYQG